MPLFAKTRSKKTRSLHSLLDFRRGFSASKKGSTFRKKSTRKNLSERNGKEKHFEKRLLNELDASLSENLLLSFSQGIKQILFIHLTSDCKNKILGPDNSIICKKTDPNQLIISKRYLRFSRNKIINFF